MDDDVKDILCYVRYHDDPNNSWIIAISYSMLKEAVKWFHIFMGHPAEKRLRESLQQRYHHNKLCHTIDKYKCEHFQRHKFPVKGYGLLLEREMKISPWREDIINLIGRCNVKVNGHMVGCNALTCIDTDSNLVKLIRIYNKTAAHVQSKFVQSWISHPPLPLPPSPPALVHSASAASMPQRGSPPICRPQDLHTVEGSHTPSSPDPPTPSLQVWQWHGGAYPLSLWGSPMGAYPVQQGYMPSEHSKHPGGRGHPVSQIRNYDSEIL